MCVERKWYLCSNNFRKNGIEQHIATKPSGPATYRVGGERGVHVLSGITIIEVCLTFLTVVGKVLLLLEYVPPDCENNN